MLYCTRFLPEYCLINLALLNSYLHACKFFLSLLDPSSFYFVAKVSDPEVLAVKINESFHSTNSTLTYEVNM